MGEICDKLCSLILDGKSELRDIYSIGLRTLISDVPEAMGKPVAHRLTSRLLSGIEQVRDRPVGSRGQKGVKMAC